MAISPIRLQVVAKMLTALRAISVAGGYHYDVEDTAVSADPSVSLLLAGAIGQKPIYTVSPELGGGRRYYPADQVKDTFLCAIAGRYDVDDLDPQAKITAWECMAADIEKCLAPRADGTVWHEGLLIDARVGEPQPFVAIGSPVVLVVVPVTMTLWRGYGQPNMTV